MTIIYRTHANRITIAEAKRLILENLPKELCGSVYARITPDGDIDWDGPVNVIEEAVVMAEAFIDRDFPVMLEQMKTEPMMRFRPAVKGYPESKIMEAEYTIAHDEFCRVADGYQLLVQIGEAARPPHALEHESATSAPVVAHVPVLLTTAPAWSLKRPKRFQGYGKPLYDLLRSVHGDGQPKPSARDVLDRWKNKPPTDVAEVTDNGLKYYDARGNTKPADLEAIRKSIGRMTQSLPTAGR